MIGIPEEYVQLPPNVTTRRRKEKPPASGFFDWINDDDESPNPTPTTTSPTRTSSTSSSSLSLTQPGPSPPLVVRHEPTDQGAAADVGVRDAYLPMDFYNYEDEDEVFMRPSQNPHRQPDAVNSPPSYHDDDDVEEQEHFQLSSFPYHIESNESIDFFLEYEM